MSLLTFLFRSLGGALGVPTQIGLLSVDVTIQESHEFGAQVTDWPIEGGSVITDHVRLEPRSLTIEGFVSDTPLDSIGLGNVRSATAFELLEQLWEARVPFIVISQLRFYTSMVIESLVIPKTRESALKFTCTMREVTIVSGQNALLPAGESSNAGASAAKTTSLGGGTGALGAGNVSDVTNAAGVDAGRQTLSPATGGETAGAKSIAASLWDAL